MITEFTLHGIRHYGEPKIKKPIELKNIKPIFSVKYGSKGCKCGVFITGYDVFIKHRDYFSQSIKNTGGAPTR